MGHAALATAYLADKDEARAKALAQKAWIDLDIPASLEPAFLKRVGGLITEADHKRRLDRLLFNDSRWTGERNERAVVIRRVIALLSEDEKKKAEARLAVFLRAKNSTQLLSKLHAHSQTAWGLAVQKAQALRPEEGEEAGRSCWPIRDRQPGAGRLVGGAARQRLCGAQMGKPKMAYDLVRNPGSPSTRPRTPPSSRVGWRCAICTTTSLRSAISRGWPRRQTAR